jgi:hypothetical protein
MILTMIKITPTKKQISLAKKKSKEMGILKNSITNGEGNVYGFLGEILVADAIDGRIKNTYDFDIIKNEITVDVKTKKCTSEPKESYYCSVAAYNIKQKCDVYVFVRIMEDFSVAWILGGITKDKFYKHASFNKKGTIDESSSFKWKFKADCYNLPISKLKEIKF